MKDDSLSDTNPVNCQHGVAMDIYCEKCDYARQPIRIVGIEKALAPSVYEREIWNAAIEEAANIIDRLNREGPYQSIIGATEIRKLKK